MIISRNCGNAWNTSKYSWVSNAVTKATTTPADSITAVTAFKDIFNNLENKTANYIKISVGADVAYITLNSTSNDVITVTPTTPFESEFIEIRDIFIATDSVAVSVTLELT